MGLNTNQNNGKFLGITNGKISLRVPEGTEGAVERKITRGQNEGKSVFEKFFDSLSGYIVGGAVERKEVGGAVLEAVVVKVKDGSETFNLNIPWGSRMRDSFCKTIPNVDVAKPVEIIVFPSKDDKGAVLMMKQNGEKLDWFYTREEPNGMPQPTKKTVKGVEKWDFSEVESFLWDETEKWFEQFDSDSAPEYQEEVPEQSFPDENAAFGEAPSDDLDDQVPF